MRRIVLGLGISLDGYIARPDGSVDFLFMPKDYSMGPFFKTIDIAIMGRKTYEVGRHERRQVRQLRIDLLTSSPARCLLANVPASPLSKNRQNPSWNPSASAKEKTSG
jgi:dihydrofolate reductase